MNPLYALIHKDGAAVVQYDAPAPWQPLFSSLQAAAAYRDRHGIDCLIAKFDDEEVMQKYLTAHAQGSPGVPLCETSPSSVESIAGD